MKLSFILCLYKVSTFLEYSLNFLYIDKLPLINLYFFFFCYNSNLYILPPLIYILKYINNLFSIFNQYRCNDFFNINELSNLLFQFLYFFFSPNAILNLLINFLIITI